ncbi:hypothetical protein AAFF_G00346710 [Aldrovandia affinis]|uniref:Uncharacterized protein n=1 Tax=Aldrovandia affinis TaxID=143900 RepID=A0AAD7SK81_9TELE|nr:hypothetical protein AAFF_G00346710 [Aldrovandia affinis]
MLAIAITATTLAILVIAQRMWVKSAEEEEKSRREMEEFSQLNKRLQLEIKWSGELEGKNKVLEFELNLSECERRYQESQIEHMQAQLITINRKCQERESALVRKQEAKAMWTTVDLMGLMNENHQSNPVCASEESLSVENEIQDMQNIRRLERLSSRDLEKEESVHVLYLGKLQDEEKQENKALLEGGVGTLQEERDGERQESPMEPRPLLNGSSRAQLYCSTHSSKHDTNKNINLKLHQEEVTQQKKEPKWKDVFRKFIPKMKKLSNFALPQQAKDPPPILILDAERREKARRKKEVYWSDEDGTLLEEIRWLPYEPSTRSANQTIPPRSIAFEDISFHIPSVIGRFAGSTRSVSTRLYPQSALLMEDDDSDSD